MERAIELARIPATTSPNPRVGAVVVREGLIIGEGFHAGAGSPHAEAKALEGVDARGATLYVNLEPCSHQGRMPPCAPAIVAAGLATVVAAIEDPDPRVAGGGFDTLRSAGVEVVTGTLADDAAELNASFIHQRKTGRPLVTLKLALTLDGNVAARDRGSRWITGPEARHKVHERRAEVDAVMVGAGTVRTDDPSLTARDVAATRQPTRVIVDSSGFTPPDARVFEPGAGTIVVTTDATPHDSQTRWKEAGAEVVVTAQGVDGRVDLAEMVRALARREWLEIYCEGGAKLATSLLADDLVDRLELYYGPVVTGDGPRVAGLGVETLASAPRFALRSVTRFGDDVGLVLSKAAG